MSKPPFQDGQQRRFLRVFSGLSDRAFDELLTLMEPLKYRKGEMIFQAGYPAPGLFIIWKGRVELVQGLQDGRQIRLKFLGPGEILGEEIFYRGAFSTDSRAVEPTELGFVDRNALLAFLKTHPSMLYKLMKKLSKEIHAIWDELVETPQPGWRSGSFGESKDYNIMSS